MLKILINAYACSPHTGSEPGMAWNWCVHLAKHCELHIITEGEFENHITKALETLPYKDNMNFYYNPVPEKVREMCWNQGDWRFYRHYKKWQYKTYKIAQAIIQNTPIDILHQLNMIGFREPGYLWKIPDIPLVWGPVDAKEAFPTSYITGLDYKSKLFLLLKNKITIWQLRYSTRVKSAVGRSTYVVSASSNSQRTFKKYFNISSTLINETGCKLKEPSKLTSDITRTNTILNIVWVGKFDFRKQLHLALRAIALSKNKNILLHVIGEEPGQFSSLAEELGIEDQLVWHGKIPHIEVQHLMQTSDLLFFTSLAEGTPHVVLEAISNHLPVLCFDTCGQGDSINAEIGRKIQVSNPEQSVRDFAAQINDLETNRELLNQMSLNCTQRQGELSWEEKVNEMLRLYKKCVY